MKIFLEANLRNKEHEYVQKGLMLNVLFSFHFYKTVGEENNKVFKGLIEYKKKGAS